MALIDAARNYAAQGIYVLPLTWPVFPGGEIGVMGRCSCGNPKCPSPAKHPIGALVPKGANSASNDPAVIEDWWTRFPEANIGIATGPSGLVILDVDGALGRKQLSDEIGKLPETLTAKTGRPDGYHLYYKGKTASSQKKGEHLDVRGTSGYVVAPPSRHINGKTYEWVNNCKISEVPDSVIKWNSARRGGGLRRPRASVAASTEVTERGPGLTDPPTQGATGEVHEPLDGRTIEGASPVRAGERLFRASLPPYSRYERECLCSALASIPADIDGRTWVSFGMALYDLNWIVENSEKEGGFSDVGFEIWDAWSSTSKGEGAGNGEYKGRSDLEKRWSKFKPDFKGVPVTIASIYEHAKSLGWKGYKGLNSSNYNGEEGVANTFGLTSSVNSIRFVDFTAKGGIAPTCANTRIALRALGIECKYDLFHGREFVNGQEIEQWVGEVADNTALAIRARIRANWKVDPSTQTTLDALTQECMEHAYDPVLDYLDGLVWDGTPRLQTWTSDYLGAQPSPINQMIGGMALVAAVRRARQPGCKFDHVIVLEGNENLGKSAAVKILAGGEEYFSDQEILTVDDRKQQELLQGVWLYEIAELTGMKRAEIERVKTFVTRQVDRTRPAYGRKRSDKPRRCVLFATCNDPEYLISMTGNRRFWPLGCAWVDQEGLEKARDQLWAEASLIEARGEPLILPKQFWGEIKALQESRRVSDPWEEILGAINPKHEQVQMGVDSNGQPIMQITTESLLRVILDIPKHFWNSGISHKLGRIMRLLGWDGPKNMKMKFDQKGEVINVRKGYSKSY